MTNMNEILTPEQIASYRAQGHSDAQIQSAIDQLQNKGSSLQQSYNQSMSSTDPRANASQSYFGSTQQPNLIQWQLELDSILERIEHLLRGDKPTWETGHIIWKKPTKASDIMLNDFGVAEIMKILSMYLNRNTILSNYDEPTINYKVYDFGMEIADLFFLKYEDMGLNTLDKRKLYPMFVRMLVDVVHSSYLRALNGGERESLREARQITQTEGLNSGYPGMPQERHFLNPARYILGKNKR